MKNTLLTLMGLMALLFRVILSESYQVAVVEYHREIRGDFEQNIQHNLKNYLRIVDEIMQHNQNMDLIVFPEGTLVFQSSTYTKEELLQHATHLPNNNLTLPCLETVGINDNISFYVRDLSCASKTHGVYISTNIIEKNTANEVFNTNIVFDRQGHVVSKYRKMKPLSMEPYITAGSKVELFETDFGMTFGVFICFDIFFRDAFADSLRNVDGYIFPSYWYSELPYLSSIQVQKMWSYLNEKLLLASGGNNASSGTSGTGIYSGRTNAYASYLSSETINKIMIAEISNANIPRKRSSLPTHIRNLQHFRFIDKHPEMHIHSLSKHLPNTTIDETICEKTFCCKFTLNVNDTSGLVLTIYNGRQGFIGFGSLGIQLCAVLQCEDDNCFTIFSRPPQSYFMKHFHYLQVEIVNATLNADYYPNLVLNNLQFVPIESFSFSGKELHLKLTTEIIDIYIFGFYGRNYQIDELTQARNNN